MDKRMNAGYEIIESIRIEENTEVVLGKKETPFGTRYATWYCRDKANYNHGHYIDDYKVAKHDLLQRSLRELDYLR